MYCLSVLVLTVFAVVSARQICPKNNPNDALAFRGRPAGVNYKRIMEYIALRCCMTGYTDIKWMKWSERERWFNDYPWDEDRDDVDIEEDGQVLQILQVRAHDEGRYICEGQNGSSTIRHEALLKVISCEPTDGKIHIVEQPVGPVTASPGDRIEWRCKGFFGCTSDGSQFERIAQWQYRDSSDVFHTVRNSSDSYTLYNDQSSDNGTVGSILVIHGVAEKDYRRTFICLLQTPGRHKSFNIHLAHPATIPDTRLYYLYMCLLFPVILIPCLLMYCLCGPRIKYWYKTTCPCSAYSPDKDGFEHDILIVRSNEDKAFVEEHVKPHIKGYKVFDKDNVQLGQIETSEMTEAIPKSYSIVIIYSKCLLMDRDADYIFQIIRGVGHRNVLVIKLENISKKDLKSILSDEILKIAHSVLPSITWPTTGTKNSRKYKNFIYDLKNKLLTKSIPIRRTSEEVCDVASSREGSTSSERPLLSKGETSEEVRDVASSRGGSTSSERPLLSREMSAASSRGTSTSSERPKLSKSIPIRRTSEEVSGVGSNRGSTLSPRPILSREMNVASGREGSTSSELPLISQNSSDSGYPTTPDYLERINDEPSFFEIKT